MQIAMTLKFATSLALYVQLLILVYLYSSHRVCFFRYLLWAWSLFVVSKASYITQQLFPTATELLPVFNAAGSAGDLLVLAAGLAYRGEFRLRWQHVALGVVYAVVSSFLAHPVEPGPDMPLVRRLIGGGALIAAGLAFWPRQAVPASPRGAKFLAVSVGLYGLHRVVLACIDIVPESPAAVVATGMPFFFYLLWGVALIILVLNRARGEVASLEELNQRLVDGLGGGLELIDADYTIRHANRWMVQQFGAVVGRRCYEVLSADGQPCPGCPLARRKEMTAAAHLQIAGPGERRFLLTCSPVHQPDGQIFLLELVADITEQEQLRARLSAAERMAAVGELAAGLAHEIRNPLAAIVNAAMLLEEEETLTAEERMSLVEALKQEGRRLNVTLSDFLLFARPREPNRHTGDIRQVVQHVALLLQEQHAQPSGMQVNVRVDPMVPRFSFDADQLTQVLWNIARNGVEAMRGHGNLSLEVGRDNGEVRIAIADTGPGIPPEERWRIFQPFFSQKSGGTGLGLAIAQRIVASHGGRIDLESAPGQGSRFTVCLPLVEGAAHG
jgi:two-component system, NtrC family, sensor histidine kinase HydH